MVVYLKPCVGHDPFIFSSSLSVGWLLARISRIADGAEDICMPSTSNPKLYNMLKKSTYDACCGQGPFMVVIEVLCGLGPFVVVVKPCVGCVVMVM